MLLQHCRSLGLRESSEVTLERICCFFLSYGTLCFAECCHGMQHHDHAVSTTQCNRLLLL